MFRVNVIWIVAAGLVLVLCSPWTAQACPGCGVANDSTVGQGFNMSIVFLMAMPFLVFGTVAGGLIYLQKKNKTHTTAIQHSEPKRGEEH